MSRNDFALGWMAGALMTFGVMLCLFVWQCGESYRQGQIDAANGIMKYELKEHDDGTTSWELKGGDA